MDQNPQSQLKQLVIKGKEQGYLTYAEVNDHLPAEIVDSEQVEDIIQMINDMGIRVVETAPDADDLALNDDDASISRSVSKMVSTKFKTPLQNTQVQFLTFLNSSTVFKLKSYV